MCNPFTSGSFKGLLLIFAVSVETIKQKPRQGLVNVVQTAIRTNHFSELGGIRDSLLRVKTVPSAGAAHHACIDNRDKGYPVNTDGVLLLFHERG